MATSSLKKSFYITKKNEIEDFAKLLVSEPKPLTNIKSCTYTKKTLKDLINANKQSK